MESSQKPNIADIAVRCGLSQSSVRAVLYGYAEERGLSVTTVVRVQRAAIEADWQPPPKAVSKTQLVQPRPKKRDFPNVKPAEYNFDADLSVALREALGEDGFLRLVERYGGIRLYVPTDIRASGLADEITIQHATTLVAAFAGLAIRVPLARRFRHGVYRRWGYSNAKIARMLGVTETAINKMNRGLTTEEDAP